ncbi:Hypothetical predicted protein, partial [Paramuricea clavata]
RFKKDGCVVVGFGDVRRVIFGNAIQADICRSLDGNLNNTFVQNSCDDSTN